MSFEHNTSNERISSAYQNSVLAGNAASLSYHPYSNLFFPYLIDNAAINKEVSLTITRFQQRTTVTDFANEKWDTNPAGFWLYNDYVWGFKETFNPIIKNSNISNAFCFNSQKLRVYIEPKGDLSGCFGGQWAYAKTKLTINGINLITGSNTLLKEFSDFDSDEDNENRYFDIVMPSVSNQSMESYLFGGVYVISMNIDYTLYEDMTLSKESLSNIGLKQQHNLQILLFSCPNEAKNVTSPFELFTEPISGDESFDQLFDKSIFKTYDGVRSPELSSDKKRAVIADQIAVLFISQHPVVTCENYPSKIIGIGVEESMPTKFAIEKAYVYARKHPEIIPMVNNRLYGMLLNYKTFAFSDEINKYFANFSQSKQKIRDPSRIIAIKDTGQVDFNFGSDGLLFNPFNVETVNASIIYHVKNEKMFAISLKKNNVEINGIALSDPDLIAHRLLKAEPFSDNKVNIAFEPILGEDLIQRIRYSIWTKETLVWMDYTDATGLTRNHTFDLTSFGGIGTDIIDGETVVSGIIKAKIEIEDVYGYVNSFYQDFFIPTTRSNPCILSINGTQSLDGSGAIDIYYNYLGTSEINNTNITLLYSVDNISWQTAEKRISGDIGIAVQPGYKKIKWYPWAELTSFVQIVYVKIELSDVDDKTNQSSWKDSSIAIPVVIRNPKADIKILSQKEIEELAMHVSSSSSESSSSSIEYSSSSSSVEFSSSSESSTSSSSSFNYSSSSSPSSEYSSSLSGGM